MSRSDDTPINITFSSVPAPTDIGAMAESRMDRPELTTEQKLCILFGCKSIREVAETVYAAIEAEERIKKADNTKGKAS